MFTKYLIIGLECSSDVCIRVCLVLVIRCQSKAKAALNTHTGNPKISRLESMFVQSFDLMLIKRLFASTENTKHRK